MNAGLLLQAAVAGLATGALYALVGLGFGLVFRLSAVLNFAHGDLVTTAVFTLLLVVGGGAAVAAAGVPGPALALGAVVAVAVAAAAAVAIYRLAVAPLLDHADTGGARRGQATMWIATTVAAGLFLRSLVGLRFQADSYTVPDILPVRLVSADGVLRLPGGGVLQLRSIAVLAVALGLAIAFDRWLDRSRTGRAMQAASQQPDSARLCGISTGRLQALAWVIAGALAAVAGILVAPARPVSLELGVVLGLKGTAAAVLGGLGSGRGTVVAGLAIGVVESVVTTMSLPTLSLGLVSVPRIGPFPALQDAGALLLLVILLALMPGRLGVAGEVLD